jgi:beta-lactam-binding protein with PASTA domain/tRNA A-37 threonylcarbamoyl transferase component Bud32
MALIRAKASSVMLSNNFEILSQIAKGRYSVIYLARNLETTELVAVKVFDESLSQEKLFVKSFNQEAAKLVKIRHANVVSILDWESENRCFLVMELKKGGSLRQVLDRSPLKLSDALMVVNQVGHGVLALHKQGIIHADIKPSNILFDESSVAAVTDFGLSKTIAQATVTEQAGLNAATFLYCSPEVAKGSDLTFKSDVYSLALVLFEAVCGYVPFLKDTSVGTLMARLESQLPKDERISDIYPVLQKATEGEPENRLGLDEFLYEIDSVAPRHPYNVNFKLVPIEINLRNKIQPEFNYENPKVKGSKKLFRILLIVFLILFTAIASFGFYFYRNYIEYSKVVPNLAGLSQKQASYELSSEDLKAVYKTSYSNKIPRGYVVSFSPKAGVKEKPGSIVKVIISNGKFPIKIPSFVNLTVQNYISLLKSEGFNTSLNYSYSSTIPNGQIISINPKVGSMLQPGNGIAIVISKGPQPIQVPAFGNLTLSQYSGELNELGFKTQLTYSYSNSVQNGQIISVNPLPGTYLVPGSAVVINVSLGPQLVKVPDVIGDKIDLAYQLITQAGLTFGGAYGPGDVVIYTSPAPGSEVRIGTSVNCYT